MWWVQLGLNLGSHWDEAPTFQQHPKTGDERAWELLGSAPGMEMGAPPCPAVPQGWDEPTLRGTLQAGMWQPEFLPRSSRSLQGREEEEEEEKDVSVKQEEGGRCSKEEEEGSGSREEEGQEKEGLRHSGEVDRAGRMRRKAWEQGVRLGSKEDDEGLRRREEDEGSGQEGRRIWKKGEDGAGRRMKVQDVVEEEEVLGSRKEEEVSGRR